MKLKLLLITHEDIGQALLKTARNTYGKLPIPTRVIGISNDTEPNVILKQLKKSIQSTHQETDILILTDMFGSTPCNIAMQLKDFPNVQVVSGLNLPMLIKVLNYPDANLQELAAKAMQGGHTGIVNCSSAPFEKH